MFTGLVEEIGRVREVKTQGKTLVLTLAAREILDDLRVGDSVAVNGVCLTVINFDSATLQAEVMPETFRRTNLSALSPGDPVNLERALPLGGRLGGHLVAGHVDTVGEIRSRAVEENAITLQISLSPDYLRYLIPQGSVAVDGTSLTVVAVGARDFTVALIPHTQKVTVLGTKRVGERVNVEVDLLARYVERLLAPRGAGGLSLEVLRENGFV